MSGPEKKRLEANSVPSTSDKPPYPFDEIVDSGAAVQFNMDGDKWCANRLPFTNMMEMEVGFGDTPMQALVELIRVEANSAPSVDIEQEQFETALRLLRRYFSNDSARTGYDELTSETGEFLDKLHSQTKEK